MVCGGRVSHPTAIERADSLDPHHQEDTRQLLQTGDKQMTTEVRFIYWDVFVFQSLTSDYGVLLSGQV